jgi:thiosulfate/3-mercaptopyruvate sulfurtransferase
MKEIVPVLLLLSLLAVSASAKDRASMIVTTAWLSEHLNDKSLVLLHVGDRREHDAGHLPGAQFISTRDISTPQEPGRLILEMPAIEQLKEAFEKLGSSNNSRIVIYFGRDLVSPAARLYDGSFDEWSRHADWPIEGLKGPEMPKQK